MQPVRVMADPARVKTEPRIDVTSAENVHLDKNAGEGSGGGNAASKKTTDQPSVKQEDKVVRCDPIHTTSKYSTHTRTVMIGMAISFPKSLPLPL